VFSLVRESASFARTASSWPALGSVELVSVFASESRMNSFSLIWFWTNVLTWPESGTDARVLLTSCLRLFSSELMTDWTEDADVLSAVWNAWTMALLAASKSWATVPAGSVPGTMVEGVVRSSRPSIRTRVRSALRRRDARSSRRLNGSKKLFMSIARGAPSKGVT
jgi:hypothetical protein